MGEKGCKEMFCSKCGAQLPENSKFCEKCGTSVVQSGETVTEKKPNKGLWKKVLFGVLGIVIVLGVGIFAYSYYETEIVPEKVEEAVGSLNVVGYEMPIASAMDRQRITCPMPITEFPSARMINIFFLSSAP